MNRITFSYPTTFPSTIITLNRGLQMNAPTWEVDVGTVSDLSFNGTVYSYKKGINTRVIPLTIDIISEEEREDLIDFILNKAEGSYNLFNYTDQDGEIHIVRFLDEIFNFEDGSIPYSITIKLLKEG